MNLIILGGGESGVGAAILGKHKGWNVFVSDYGQIQTAFKAELDQFDIEYEEEKHTFERIEKADLVIKSPGIPDKVPVIKRLKSLGKEIIDEIEFGFRYCENAKIIAITGSNGKTTVTGLTHYLLEKAGLKAGIAGNIGFSFAKKVALEQNDFYVLEVSSFQLDYCTTFRPDIAILINITPDHLDRYDYKMENYIASKFRITQNQTTEDLFIFNKKDQNTQQFLIETQQQEFLNATKIPVEVIYNQKNIQIGESQFDTNQISMKGPHNHFNATCAVRVAQELGIRDEVIEEGLATFVNAPHRLEWIMNIHGIDFINDSKATNIDSTFQALKAMDQPIIWIAGGQDKGNDYNILASLVKEKVKALICLCEDNTKLIAAFKDIIPIIQSTKDVNEAVAMSQKLAQKGEVILLSPACASFDLFKNYIARGDQFRQAVLNINN
mgnify:CR=1 FL=1